MLGIIFLRIFYTKHIDFNWLNGYNKPQKKLIGASVLNFAPELSEESQVFCNEYYRLEKGKNQGGFINI